MVIGAQRKQAPPWAAFARRVRTPREARLPLPMVPVEDARREFEGALECTGPGPERVAYVHLPFCRSLCSFCGYGREVPSSRQSILDYLAALRRQLAAVAGRPWTRCRPFSAIHVGGGTPTLLSPDVLAGIIRDLLAALPLAPGAEITVESTISDLEAESFSILRAAGVNRLALGVQSFDTGLRRSLGRRSPRQVVLARILEARAAGFDNVCVDLLYGLPGQTADLWHADLEAARTCGATGVSAYPLVSFPASRLGRQLSEEKRGAFIDLATEYALFMAADRAFVEKQGWARFTPVQYGDAHAGIATYVASCGRGAEVLALGAAAGGNLGRLVYLNAPGVADYVRGWAEPARWPLTAARSSDAQELARPLWRLGETTRLVRAPGEHAFVDEIIGTLVALGLATSEADGVSLTPAGCFWAGNVNELFSLAARDEARRS